MPKKQKKIIAPPTAKHIPIGEIRDDVTIMNDGTLRSVLLVSSINFALKSADEQEAIVQSYISFLNSLDAPLQVVIQSRRMNIEPYMLKLKEQQRLTQNELLRTQIADYTSFIQELLEIGEIMQKRFYVVVSYDPLSDKGKKFFSRITDVLSPSSSLKLNQKEFKDRKERLERRSSMIQGHLEEMGLSVIRLDTQSLIELYYTCYNPDIFDLQKIRNLADIRVES
ncbi:hypothetical protein HYV73_02000 [Candidatus Uhrbacteria bacterium]|nr:hypothetical protein [Candidatus Uhrbacteria bacterium]